MSASRYHLALTSNGQPLMHGWWGSEATARRKLAAWIGEHGDRPGTRVTLVDEETSTVLTEWPTPP